jgi:hypothetical protein
MGMVNRTSRARFSPLIVVVDARDEVGANDVDVVVS